MSHAHFKEITIENFGGIEPDSPLAVVFGNDYKGLTVFAGDQETRKTCALMAIEASLGANFTQYYVNRKTGKVSIKSEFVDDYGNKYRSTVTKTQYKLEQWLNIGGVDKWKQTGEDKSLVRKLMPYANDPEILKDKDGDEQILWLKKLAGNNDDDSNLLTQYKAEYAKRTDKNKEVVIYKKQLLESKLFVEEDKVINPTPEFVHINDALSETDVDKSIALRLKSLNEAKQKEVDYNKSVNAINNFDVQLVAENNSISEIEEEITRLQKKIQEKRTNIDKIIERKAEGQKYVEENKSIPYTVKTAEIELEEARKLKLDKEQILHTDKIYKDYNKATEEVHILNATIDDIQQQRMELAKSFTPDIPGFEARIGNALDDEKGLYYNGINIATLSESERFGLCLKIWEHFKISVVMIENITSLGSHAMEIINLFISNGGTVFATKMKRGQKKISVSFSLNE